jgi:cytosine/adenosine deaminase-related metal-dependent hydrolase
VDPSRGNSEDVIVVGNGTVTDGLGVFLENGAVVVRNGRIAETGGTDVIRAKCSKEGLELIDVGGRLILPGFLNAHHHLYSTLAPGIRPRGRTDTFEQILENLWWPLDSALNEEAVSVSALLGIIDSIRHGTTMIFDHHASMGFVKGSLGIIGNAFVQSGIKGSLCFEVSDRRGEAEAAGHIDENLAFHDEHRNDPRMRGMMGLHANLTLSESTLGEIRRRKPEELSIHTHCGEDAADLRRCRELGYQGPVDRLHRFGLLDRASILAHAVHLSETDYEILESVGPVVAANTESNANNRVGRMDGGRIRRCLLGTDGMSGDMIASLRSHFLLSDRRDLAGLEDVFFRYKAEVQNRFFPGTGSFETGSAADIAVPDYVPISPIEKRSLIGHLLFGARGGKVYLTMSDGRVLYRRGKITFLDEDSLNREAKGIAGALHRRYYG